MSDTFPTAGRSDGGGSVQGEGGAALGPDRGDGGRAREHGGLLEVSWTAPASAQSITGYEVKYWKAADPEGESFRTHLTGSTDKSMLLYPFLDANTEYKLRVRARNAIGGGAWSEVARERTGAEQPGKPIMSLQVVDGNGSDIDTITAGGTFRYRVKLTNIRNHHFTSDGGSDPGYDPDDHGWGTFGIRGHHAMDYNYDNGASLSCEGGALLLRGASLLPAFVETFATSGYWDFVSPVIPADAVGRGPLRLQLGFRCTQKYNNASSDGVPADPSDGVVETTSDLLTLGSPSGACLSVADGTTGVVSTPYPAGEEGTRALKAWFVTPPERHDRTERVKVRVAFSERIDETPENVGEHGVRVEGGRVTSAQQVGGQAPGGAGTGSKTRSVGSRNAGSQDREVVWEFEVEPSSAADVTVALDAGRACCCISD